MLPVLRTCSLGPHVAVRGYSTLGGSSGAGFLTDLMKRIDTINLKSEKIAHTQSQLGASPQAAKKRGPAPAGPTKKTQKPPKETAAPRKFTRAPVKAKIAVKDHPLSSNMFKLMDEKNFQRGGKPSGSTGAGQGPRPAFRGGNAAGPLQGRPQQKNKQFGDRRMGARKPGASRGSVTAPRGRKPVQPASIVPKKLQSAALKPMLNGDVFLHGKPAKLGVCTSSRVAAVAKECLLESHYPYKLPRSIIDSIDETYSGNTFLLQKDWDLTVDPNHFKDRIQRVVKGETDTLQAAKDASPAEQDTCRGLMSNGSLSMENRQTIYDVVAGVQNAQALLKDAAWNK